MTTGHGNLPRGMDLISHQGLNKGTALTDAERAALPYTPASWRSSVL
jgi:hypothetical protein